jgi:hypothetical protein
MMAAAILSMLFSKDSNNHAVKREAKPAAQRKVAGELNFRRPSPGISEISSLASRLFFSDL